MKIQFWLEQEYTIVDKYWKPVSHIDETPSVDVLIQSASKNDKNLLWNLDTELYAWQLEIKTTQLCNSVKEWFDQIFSIKSKVEQLPEMKSNSLNLMAIPLIESNEHDIIWTMKKSHHKDMVSSLLDKNLYSHSDIEKALTLASTQVNISGFFENLNQNQSLLLWMKMLNFLSSNEKNIYSNNSLVTDSLGKTRRDYYNIIPHSFKAESFEGTEYSIQEISHFQNFDTIDSMLEYLCYHNMKHYDSNIGEIEQFEKLSDKLFHMFVWKIKKDDFRGFEMRWFDCTEDTSYVADSVREFLEFIQSERAKILSK